MRSSNILIVGLLVLNASKCVLSAKKFWWMDDASVFGGSNQRKQNGFSQQLQLPKQPQQNQISQVVTECPAGTKCVQDFFCNENAVMVSYRVSLTPEQKKRRGDLIPCLNGNDGNFDVCCSTATSGQLQQQEYLPPQQNTQAQAAPSNQNQLQPQQANNGNGANGAAAAEGTCPNIEQLPMIEQCEGKESVCWSVGLKDVDCEDNQLCCFDGCINACYMAGRDMTDIDPPALMTPAPPLPEPVPAVPAPAPPPVQQQPPPAPPANQNQQNFDKSKTVIDTTTLAATNRRIGQGDLVFEKPFVMCPSAMNCIKREFCDYQGFIADEPQNLSEDVERVPLIPCVNPDDQQIDVCCIDGTIDYFDDKINEILMQREKMKEKEMMDEMMMEAKAMKERECRENGGCSEESEFQASPMQETSEFKPMLQGRMDSPMMVQPGFKAMDPMMTMMMKEQPEMAPEQKFENFPPKPKRRKGGYGR